MIGQREVQRLAYERQTPEQMIERDYILTWVMTAIATDEALSQLIAKGGTVLKKLYFADWRYSEDLDYTATQRSATERLRPAVERACRNLHTQSGIECSLASMEPRSDGEQLHNVTFYLDYIGPLRRTRRPRQLKLDVTFDERVVNAPIHRPLLHAFSDEPNPPVEIAAILSAERVAKYRTAWERRLGEQVPELPALDRVVRETRRYLRELVG